MISPHKAEVQAVARMLDAAEYPTVDDLAHALLVKAWELYESRACRYMVAGQLHYQGDLTPTDEIEDRQELGRRPEVSPYVKPGDPRENLVALGPFPTLAQARTAGKSLADSTASREEYRWWAVPVWTGTPGAYHAERARLRKAHVSPTLDTTGTDTQEES